jgi:hypothetical protein
MSKESEENLSEPKDLSDVLWVKPSSKNGYKSEEQYREHIIDQYKTYLEMADRISSRRDIANAFFLTLNGAFLGAAGALIDKGYSFEPKWALLFPLSVFLLECFFWWRLIISYKQLNGAKFNIVGEFESKLPASPYREAEWIHLLKEGKDRKTYWPLTHLESKIPVLFAIGYIIAAIALFCS